MVVTWPSIQSIVVVTSPMGLHAPPALAAITAMPPSTWEEQRAFMVMKVHGWMLGLDISGVAAMPQHLPHAPPPCKRSSPSPWGFA